MITRWGLKLSLAVLIPLLAISCSIVNDPAPVDEYEQANRQITEGNYNAAVAVMKERLDRDPSDQRARLILASAYAARGGVFLKEFITIAQFVSQKYQESDAAWNQQNAKVFQDIEKNLGTDQQKDAVRALGQIQKTIFQVDQIVTIFNQIRPLTAENENDLQTAVQLLTEEKSYRYGPALYRGLLRLLLLRTQLGTKYGLSELGQCAINFKKMAKNLKNLKNEIGRLMQDFILGTTTDNQGNLPATAGQLDQQLTQTLDLIEKFAPDEAVEIGDVAKKLGIRCAR